MEKDYNLPKNLSASSVEDINVSESASNCDLQTFSGSPTPLSDEILLQNNPGPTSLFNEVFDSSQDNHINIPVVDISSDEQLDRNRSSLDSKFTESTRGQDEPIGKNAFIRQFIDDPINHDQPVQKFPFLRRGQGTARYGSKKLIGFKRRGANEIKDCKYTPEEKVPSQSLRNFETLEELVEHSSFVSNSSQINALLQATDSVSCTPVKEPFIPNKAIRHKNYHPTGRNILNLLNQQEMPCPATEKPVGSTQEISNSFPSDSGYPSNTIFTNEGNHKINKVHFPKRGVEVLEYEHDMDDSTAIALEDSDLVTFSDLEGLVDFKMHHLMQSIDPPTESHNNKILTKSNKENVSNTETNTEEMKTLKILLASKIQYLNKEILAFRDLNEYLKHITEECEQEKQKYQTLQKEAEEKLKNCSCAQRRVQLVKMPNKESTHEQKLISKQLHELLTSMKSVDHDIKDIQQKMPQRNKPKPFCNLKLISKPNVTAKTNQQKVPKMVNFKQQSRRLPSPPNDFAERESILEDDMISPSIANGNENKNSTHPLFNTANRDADSRKIYPYGEENNLYIAKRQTVADRHCYQNEQCPEPRSGSTTAADRTPPNMRAGAKAGNVSNAVRSNPSIVGNSAMSPEHLTFEDRIEYRYPNQSVITKYNDGKEVRLFANGQKETYFPDESYEVAYADHSIRSVYSDGTDIFVAGDGTTKTIRGDGSTSIQFPNGQREDQIDGKVVRSYPDGTVKILYPNGRQETRYANGKIRIKDRHGNLLS